ncbi:CLUMA_CG020912, isoform A [Clunio marinus]|uniref:CLUMA_CG020912, isoform A n=1 Tax=Clunio marinus TaxID=568069 RepID=A0A1J1J762_9DIPT|nr:CLUMA_CG020912, isoform A [Clunio marinus]
METQFETRKYLCFLIFAYMILWNTVISHDEAMSSSPKFGDRIGKLKRIYQFNNTGSAKTPTTATSLIKQKFDVQNEIHRSDNYLETDEEGTKRIKENSIDTENFPSGSKSSNVQINSSSSSLVQARLEMLTDFFDIPPSPMPSVFSTPSRPMSISKTGVVLATKNYINPTTNTTYKGQLLLNETGLRQQAWVIPIIVLACMSMFLMAAFEVFVLVKTRRTSPNRRHLFLGQMLLLGLFSCTGLSALLTARPSTLSCATIRFGTGVSFAIVFSSLLVKCIFLISLNGGIYLPAPYQALLLLFAVLIQLTVGIQWLITASPGITIIKEVTQQNRLIFTSDNFNAVKDGWQLCRTSFTDMRISLLYIDFLIIVVAILAIKSRGIRDNYREATFIGLAISLVIPIWLGWTLVGFAVHERHKDACLAFGLLATPSIIFLVMFMPKGRQLAAMGREDIYNEDRDERYSTSSRTGSGYSPSFFHFKPIKYGMMNGKGGNSIETNNKHQQAVSSLGGDYALAAPMSFYTPTHTTSPMYYYTQHKFPPPQYAGLFVEDDTNAYTTLEQTMSSNPNVYFQRPHVHPGMIY